MNDGGFKAPGVVEDVFADFVEEVDAEEAAVGALLGDRQHTRTCCSVGALLLVE